VFVALECSGYRFDPYCCYEFQVAVHNSFSGLPLESHKHAALKLLRQIPSIGPIRAAPLVALLQTPHRFRSKRQLWAYSGFAVEVHDSGEYRLVRGKLQRHR
jgi:transposase